MKVLKHVLRIYDTNPNCKFLFIFFLVPVLCFHLRSRSKYLQIIMEKKLRIKLRKNCVSRPESTYAAWFIRCLSVYTPLSKNNCVENCVNSNAGQSNFLCTMTCMTQKHDRFNISGLVLTLTGYSFWDRLRSFLHKFTRIVLSVHNLNKPGKFW